MACRCLTSSFINFIHRQIIIISTYPINLLLLRRKWSKCKSYWHSGEVWCSISFLYQTCILYPMHLNSFSGDLSCTSVLQVSNLCPFFLLVPGRMTAEGLLGLVIVAFPGFSITCTYTCNYFPLFSDRVFIIGHLFTRIVRSDLED